MPTYTYRCSSCEASFTIEARMQDPPPQSCPSCSGSNLQKLMSPVMGWVKGSSPAPAASSKPNKFSETSVSAADNDPVHLCSKYCDHHKKI